jgi:DNA-binding NarL/FixJ family response regulator
LADGNLSGLLAIPEIRSKHPEIRLVLLLDRTEREIVVQAFRLGVMGVFDRSQSDFKQLCRCTVCVHQGQLWANTEQPKFVVEAFAQAPGPWVADSEGVNLLTRCEQDFVGLVADGLGNRALREQKSLSQGEMKSGRDSSVAMSPETRTAERPRHELKEFFPFTISWAARNITLSM